MSLLRVKKLDERAADLIRAYEGDAGLDLHVLEETTIPPGEGVDVRTGIAVALSDHCYGRVVGRSSALRRRGLLVVEGIIDSGFRGELYSYAVNTTKEDVTLQSGDSIAQLIVSPIPYVTIMPVAELPDSQRGENGFGSSGR